MPVADTITSLNQFDLLIILVLFGMFILGFMQGTIRRLLGIASMLFAFLVAANLRGPIGDYLTQNWTHMEAPYAVMVGFGTVFFALAVTASIGIQMFYRKVPLFPKFTVIDEVLGGTLGVVQGVVILAIMVAILDSAFEIPGMANRNELPLLREIHDAYDTSTTAAVIREQMLPSALAALGPFVPDGLRSLFPTVARG